jgi:hypothetical protein
VVVCLRRMIVWQGNWRAFDAPARKGAFLRELAAETGESNPRHPLHGKNCCIVGWCVSPFQRLPESGSYLPGWKDFILHLPEEDRYAYVHLTWSKETDPQHPRCRLFGSIGAVNEFLGQRPTE